MPGLQGRVDPTAKIQHRDLATLPLVTADTPISAAASQRNSQRIRAQCMFGDAVAHLPAIREAPDSATDPHRRKHAKELRPVHTVQ